MRYSGFIATFIPTLDEEDEVGASGVTMGAEDPDEAGPWLYGGARGDAVDPTPPCKGWPTRG